MAHTGLMPLDLVFSFDTTGSMCSVLDEVRKNIAEMLERLAADIPEIRVALIAHGDYGDVYETEIRDFGTSTADLVRFANTVSLTGGSDTPECYELVLQQARTHLTWRKKSSRALVLIGDAYPHEVGSSRNMYKIDWKAEVELLRQLGVTVYCVQCRVDTQATGFMEHVAKVTGGLRLPLAEIRGVRDFLMAIAYREGGSDTLQDVYEHEVRAREGAALSGDVSRMLGLVRRTSATSAAGDAAGSIKRAATLSSATNTATRRAKMAKAAARATPATTKKTVKKSAVATGTKKLRKETTKNNRVRRETCSAKKLPAPLASLSWSPWRLVGQPGSVSGSSWQRLGSGSVRRSLTCSCSSYSGGQRAVELAVQPRPGARRFPLFGRVLSVGGGAGHRRSLSVVTFGQLLSGRPSIRSQLLRVLNRGMRVFARIGSAGSAASTTEPGQLPRIVKAASYAWNSGRSVRCSGVFVSVSEKSLR